MTRTRTRTRRQALAAALATGTAVVGAATMATPAAHAATAFPAHVFAPYFEAYSSDDPATIAQNSGAKYLSMAFVQTPSSGSCTVDWNGSTGQPIGTTFASSIATIRSRGGDVIPSFGGYTADTTNTEIADSCTSVTSIASAIENVITKYDLARVDFDVEQDSLTNSAGIDRRNKALKQVESWATTNGRPLQVSYTLPTNTTGLDSGGQSVISNAVSNGTRVDVVNIMTFDYYTGGSHEMATATETAASGLVSQLGSLYPSKTGAQLWAMVGVTEMPGIDDYGSPETFTQADATTVYNWAVGKGVNEISMWASERDNGGCVGTAGSDTCSGISQPTWFFSDKWDPFTSGTTAPGNDFSVSVSPASASVTAGGTATATVSTAVTSGSAESVALSATGGPAGSTVTFSPASVNSGGTSTLSVATTASTTPGTYTITVKGTAASGSHTATYTVTVGSGGGTTCTPAQLIANPGFESGDTGWTTTSTLGFDPVTNDSGQAAHAGSYKAWFNGNGSKDTDTLAQSVTIPSGCKATLSYWQHIDTTESTTTAKPDTFKVQVLNSSGTVLATVATFSNLDKNSGYAQKSYDLSAYAGQTVTLKWTGAETDANGGTTNFVIDDTALQTS
jgi:hypothetical protein